MAALRASANDLERTYTNAEFEQMPEYNEGYELVNGKLVEPEVPNTAHGWIARKLNRAITLFDPAEQLGTTWFDTSVVLADNQSRIPNLMFFVAGNQPQFSTSSITLPPDLVVEIVSPANLRPQKNKQEFEAKIAAYRQLGVRLIWVIYPETKTIEIYHPNQKTPIHVLDVKGQLNGEAIIPGFTLEVADLFA